MALATIQRMAQAEAEACGGGRAPLLVYNGDFNWFQDSIGGLSRVNGGIREACRAGRAVAVQGNVEAELGRPLVEAPAAEPLLMMGSMALPMRQAAPAPGCGCGYPLWVDEGTVARSNAIMERLRTVAAAGRGEVQGLLRWAAGLPMHARLRVAGLQVGVVHGDLSSLAGWSFAVEAMAPRDPALPWAAGARLTTGAEVRAGLGAADVDVLACTHTCLPFMQDFGGVPPGPRASAERRVIANNGSAGMANFRGDPAGLITRIAPTPAAAVPGLRALYGTEVDGAHIEAIAVDFDQAEWQQYFLRRNPPGSPAHTSYWARICNGPETYSPASADRLGLAA